MNAHPLKAEKRTIVGRKISNLRKQGILPANVYGKGISSESIQITLSEFKKVYKEVGETGLVELDLGNEKKPVLVNNIQQNPVTGEPIHVDFFQVNLKEKVSAQVPVELTGESPAEKQAIGTAVQYVKEVEVEALPADLPENFVVDISELSEVDQAIYVKDLKYDKEKIEIKSDVEQIVVKVEPPQKEEELPAPVVEGETGEGATETSPEGEAQETPAASEENKE